MIFPWYSDRGYPQSSSRVDPCCGPCFGLSPVSPLVAQLLQQCIANGAHDPHAIVAFPGELLRAFRLDLWGKVPIWVCLKMLAKPRKTHWFCWSDHPVFKWLFHWEYTLFSDKPIGFFRVKGPCKTGDRTILVSWRRKSGCPKSQWPVVYHQQGIIVQLLRIELILSP